jgi:hypothetical protein
MAHVEGSGTDRDQDLRWKTTLPNEYVIGIVSLVFAMSVIWCRTSLAKNKAATVGH